MLPIPTAEAIAKAQVGQLILNPDTLEGYNVDYGILIVSESDAKESRRIEIAGGASSFEKPFTSISGIPFWRRPRSP